jgi:hypothetical protein
MVTRTIVVEPRLRYAVEPSDQASAGPRKPALAAPGFSQTGRLTILSVMFPALCIFQIQRIKGNFFIRNLAGGRQTTGIAGRRR